MKQLEVTSYWCAENTDRGLSECLARIGKKVRSMLFDGTFMPKGTLISESLWVS